MKNQFKLWLSASCVAVAVGMPAVAQEEDAESVRTDLKDGIFKL